MKDLLINIANMSESLILNLESLGAKHTQYPKTMAWSNWQDKAATRLIFNDFFRDEINIVCDNIYVFIIKRRCWKCGRETDCICIGTDSSIDVGTRDSSRYLNYNKNTLLFYEVKTIPQNFAAYLKEKHNYFPSYSKTAKKTYYVNHCNYCGALQGDFYLHHVIDTSFYNCLFSLDEMLHYDGVEDRTTNYFPVDSKYSIAINAVIPEYDILSSSAELAIEHMKTEVENWASIRLTQGRANEILIKAKRI